MLISPPFLDGTTEHDSDEVFVDEMMQSTGAGHFPVSRHLAWHGGLHLQAPSDQNGNPLPVRAIADGMVVLVHLPTGEPKNATEMVAKCNNINDPLAYGGKWTSDGAVVIKHESTIGANGDAPVKVTFYSVYQHLTSIGGEVKEGQRIWRRDVIGRAGYIGSQVRQIHFEIVADKSNIEALIGRRKDSDSVWPPAAGRTDSLWGDTYFAVPDGLPVYTSDPRRSTQAYTPQTGDTASSVATAFHTTVAKLQQLNGKASLSEAAFTAWLQAQVTDGDGSTYTVRSGDNLSAIAAVHATTSHVLQTLNHLPDPNRIGVGQVLQMPSSSIRVPPAPIGNTCACLIVMSMFKSSTLTSTTPDGEFIGSVTEDDYEYELYDKATALYPHCASAGYELLRFGKVIGPDTLSPEDSHEHYRKASLLFDNSDVKVGYIDLNADHVVVFSEADFAPINGWTLIDDDANGDARCDSPTLYATMQLAYAQWQANVCSESTINAINMVTTPVGAHPLEFSVTPFIRPLDAPPPTMPSLNELIQHTAVEARMARMIVHSPSEWDKKLIEKRWSWLTKEKDAEVLEHAKQDANHGRHKAPTMGSDGMLTRPGYDLFVKHVKALAFWDDEKVGLKSTDTWRFDPRQFIKTWRKCGWLSLDEMAQMMPRHPGEGVTIKWSTVAENNQTSFGKYNIEINESWLRYGMQNANRVAGFVAQIYVESVLMTATEEYGKGQGHSYGPFYGRGLMQLTWPANYYAYGEFRNIPDNVDKNYIDSRITSTSTHEWASGGTHKKWSPRYDPDIVATNAYDACDSACFYWIWKHFDGHRNLNRIADQGLTTEHVGHINVYVNGGGNGYDKRIRYTPYSYRVLSDDIDTATSKSIRYNELRLSFGSWRTRIVATAIIDFTPQRP